MSMFVLLVRTLLQVSTVLWVGLGAWALWRLLKASTKAQLAAGLSVFGVALAQRLARPPSPHDLNYRSADLMLETLVWDQQFYGIGRLATWRLLLGVDLFGGIELSTVAHVTALCGALTAVAVMIWVHQLGAKGPAAIAAGLCVALDPMLVLFGHTESPQIQELLPFWMGIVALTAHAQQANPRLAALGAASVIVAVCQRPEGVLLLPLLGLLALSIPPRLPRERSTWVALAACALVPLLHLILLRMASPDTDPGRMGWGSFGPFTYGPAHWLAYSPQHEGWLYAVLAFLSLPFAPFSRAGRVGFAAFVLGLGLLVPETAWSPGSGPEPLVTRHHLRMLPAAAAAVGFAVHAVSQRVSARTAWAVLSVVVVLRLVDRPHVHERYTLVEEYTFQRTHFGEIPRECTVISHRGSRDMGLMPDGQTGDGAPLTDWRWITQDGRVPGPEPTCLFWYRSSMCSAPEESMPCTHFEARHTLETVGETEVANRPWLRPYAEGDALRVGLYRVLDPQLAPQNDEGPAR